MLASELERIGAYETERMRSERAVELLTDSVVYDRQGRKRMAELLRDRARHVGED